MSTEKFIHGVVVTEVDSGPRPIAVASSSVIGIVGTAPDSAPEVKAALSTGTVAANNALTWTSKLNGVLGNKISVRLTDPKAASASLAITVTAQAITVSLATDNSKAITTTAAALKTAIEANAAASALVGLANTGASTGAGVLAALATTFLSGGANEAFPLNTPTLVAGSRTEAAKLGTTGTLPAAMDSIFDQAGAVVVVVRVAEGADDAETMANVIGGMNAESGQYEGVHAWLGAESAVGAAPRILIAPGFTHTRTGGNANPVVAEMIGIAERLGATIAADLPSTTDADALAWAGDFGSRRVYPADPRVTKLDANGSQVYEWTSPIVAGLIAKSDNERGFWWSPSNQAVNGIIGTERIDINCHGVGDTTTAGPIVALIGG